MHNAKRSLQVVAVLVVLVGTSVDLGAAPALAKGRATMAPSAPRQASVVSLRTAPSAVGPAGGQVRVAATVAHAGTCQLKLVSAPGLEVLWSHNPVDCRNGAYAARVIVGPNRAHVAKHLDMDLVVHDAAGSRTVRFTVSVAAASLPTTTTTTTSTSAPTAPLTSLPPSVPPSATTVPGAASTTTSSTSTTLVSGPSPQMTAPLAMGASSWTSLNWSGYGVSGGPFTAASGTFTVPSLTGAANSTENMSAWVGIDGWGNDNLIQAGVDEDVDPSSGRVDIWPWWEILPAASAPITTVSVSEGDSVTVTIWQVSGTLWEISLVDNTNGQSFATQQSYSGSGASAEWIVEAPENGTNQTIYPIAPYSPSVSFTNLGIAGGQTALNEVTLSQGSPAADVSTPSGFSSSGFTVSYNGSYTGTTNGPAGTSNRDLISYYHGPGSTGPIYQG